jgi:hypothetical protein
MIAHSFVVTDNDREEACAGIEDLRVSSPSLVRRGGV